jgi:hypothetical protein
MESLKSSELRDTKLPQVFGSLIKPQTSLFPSSTSIVGGHQVTETPNGPVVRAVPELLAAERAEKARQQANADRSYELDKERTAATIDNMALDNKDRQAAEKQRTEEHAKQLQLREEEIAAAKAHRSFEEQQALQKAQQSKYESFQGLSKDFLPVYTSTKAARDLLEKYKDKEIPGFSPLFNAKKLLSGGMLVSPEETEVRGVFAGLRGDLQKYKTGAAANKEEMQNILQMLGDDPTPTPERVRAALPSIIKYVDAINRQYRSTLGTPEEQEQILRSRGSELQNYLGADSVVTSTPAAQSVEANDADASYNDPEDDKDIADQDAIAKKLGIDPAKVRSIRKVK